MSEFRNNPEDCGIGDWIPSEKAPSMSVKKAFWKFRPPVSAATEPARFPGFVVDLDYPEWVFVLREFNNVAERKFEFVWERVS